MKWTEGKTYLCYWRSFEFYKNILFEKYFKHLVFTKAKGTSFGDTINMEMIMEQVENDGWNLVYTSI